MLYALYYTCRFNYSPVIPLIKTDLDISNTHTGWIMSSFFISYTLFQIPSGILGDRFGPRRILTLGGIITIAGNLIISQGTTLTALLAGQMINGLGQSLGWNSGVKMIVTWFPRKNRATALGLFITCVTIGSSFGFRLSGFLGTHWGWQSAFMIPPVMLGLILLIFWFTARDTPKEKGFQDFNDEIYIESLVKDDLRSRAALIAGNRSFWLIGVIYFLFVYAQFGCLVWIPSFVVTTWHIDVDHASLISSLILLPGVLAAPLSGYISDRYFNGRRKELTIISLGTLSLSCLALASGIGMHMGFIILAVVGLMIIMPDIMLASFPSDFFSRKLAATAMGFLATFTSTSGIISTSISGKLADMTNSFSISFICFGLAAGTGAMLAWFIKENRQA